MQPQSDEGVDAFIQAYVAKHRAMDVPGIMADWEDDETVFYIAEEHDDPMIGVSAISRYWTENTVAMGQLGVRIGDIRTRVIAPGVVSALFPLHWDATLKGGGPAVGGDIKAAALVRWAGDRWLFTQWTESALGPLPFLRRIYQRNATPGFAN